MCQTYVDMGIGIHVYRQVEETWTCSYTYKYTCVYSEPYRFTYFTYRHRHVQSDIFRHWRICIYVHIIGTYIHIM